MSRPEDGYATLNPGIITRATRSTDVARIVLNGLKSLMVALNRGSTGGQPDINSYV